LRNVTLGNSDRQPPVLTRVNLSIRANEMIGIVGPNGSGKTLLLSVIAGLATPSMLSAAATDNGALSAAFPHPDPYRRVR
jgi:ABC-type Mn2+/Zn2+ transport system ATPase subunit